MVLTLFSKSGVTFLHSAVGDSRIASMKPKLVAKELFFKWSWKVKILGSDKYFILPSQ